MKLEGTRIAIAGMGVSGLAVGKAVLALGGMPLVFDQKPNDSPAVMSAVDALDAQGIEAVTGWHGHLDPQEFDVLVVSPGFPRHHPAIKDMLAAGHPVWSEVEFAYRIARAPILAITGTNGKSTTTVLLWTLVNAGGRRAVLCGNIAGSGYPEMALTEAALAATENDVLVAEISSYHLEWTDEFCPLVAAVTNISPDHMDRYGEFYEYREAKLRIFRAMGPGKTAVINSDEPSVSLRDVEDSSSHCTIIGFSPGGSRQGNGRTMRRGETLVLSDQEVRIDELPIFGEHNVANVMMAWEMASRVCELEEPAVAALKAFKGLANRMEVLGSKGGVLVVNNSMCTNPAAVIASSQGLHQKQHILMGGVTKNLDFAPVGRYLEGTEHKVYLYGPGHEKLRTMLGHDWPVYESLKAAFMAATDRARNGESILLAPGCASAEPYVNFKERGDDFKRIVSAWMAEQ